MNIKQNVFDLDCDASRRKTACRAESAESFPCLGRGNRLAERSRKAFTLIELLVVVAIIGILVALLFPVISSVRKSAKRGAAKADMQSIETAVDQYYAEYRRMPFADCFHGSPPPINRTWRDMTEQRYPERFAVPGGGWHHDASAYTDTDAGRLAICAFATLQGSNEFEGKPTDFNPREEQFLQRQEGRPFGHFMDPWSKGPDITADPANRLYSLLFDQNLNEKIEVCEIERVIRNYLVTGKRIVVNCYGPNRTCDYKVTNADYDDLYNLNIDNILKHHGK